MTTHLATTFIFTGLDLLFLAAVGVVLAAAAVVARLVIGNKPRTFELPAAAPAHIPDELPISAGQIADEPAEQAAAS